MKTVVAASLAGLSVGVVAGAWLRPPPVDPCIEERQKAAAALAALHPDRRMEAAPEAPKVPELGDVWQQAAVQGQLDAVAERTGAAVVQLDCEVLPCLAALRFPDEASVREAPQAINLSFTEPVMSAFILARFPPAGATEPVPWMFLALAPADLDESYLNHMRERMRVFRDDLQRSEGAK